MDIHTEMKQVSAPKPRRRPLLALLCTTLLALVSGAMPSLAAVGEENDNSVTADSDTSRYNSDITSDVSDNTDASITKPGRTRSHSHSSPRSRAERTSASAHARTRDLDNDNDAGGVLNTSGAMHRNSSMDTTGTGTAGADMTGGNTAGALGNTASRSGASGSTAGMTGTGSDSGSTH